MRCLQIDLTPPGTRWLFGIDQDVLRNRVVDLADLFGTEAERFDRLAAAPGWPARFRLVEAWLAARLAAAPALPPGIATAWAARRRLGGATPTGALAVGAGLSRQAFARGFAREIGLTPKRAARVLRLDGRSRSSATRRCRLRRWRSPAASTTRLTSTATFGGSAARPRATCARGCLPTAPA